MNIVSIGDMSSTFQNRIASGRLKGDLQRLGVELSTGRRTDPTASTAGDFGPLANIEHVLSTFSARSAALKEVGTLSNLAQNALETVQAHASEAGANLLAVDATESAMTRRALSDDARSRLDAVVAALNTQAAGRSIFGGAATDTPPLASAKTLMATVEAAVSGETTASGVSSAIDAWFKDVGGGFDTTAYQGADIPMGPFPLSDGAGLTIDARADDSAIRSLMAGLAKAALASSPALALPASEAENLLSQSGRDMLAAGDQITDMRANLGTLQARIEKEGMRLASEKDALEIARNELVGVDQYETATALQEAYAQLETLYTVTARMSRLSLTDFMR